MTHPLTYPALGLIAALGAFILSPWLFILSGLFILAGLGQLIRWSSPER